MDRCNRHSSKTGSPRGARQWDEVDAALLALIRVVLDDSWSARQAAEQLRERTPDPSVFIRVRTRIRNALAERSTPVAQRAAQTLDVLLGEGVFAVVPPGSAR